ncbi:peptide/nickel transport system ATP-binding protein [Devosia lucknowensis]|uniref:Peptide/nickel transport system ATP-binding protein n=1 Tax=Devosia lucknowensis TaxID=1096929 RepID=A0A1Y6G9V1_9HYPH|nr:ABC transporter ATP-binding protein [Devosia lucknowensis]SMQ85488.1 peptide/nickel transport system ATP-binding protein [Devosia lucknowensis]
MHVAQVSAAPDAPQTDADVVLSVDHLSLDFRLRNEVLHAARDVSFKLRRGKTLCLVGESGSGKSVTARALMRIIDRNGAIANGSITLYGDGQPIDIAQLDERSRALLAIRGGRIGLIFQEPMSSLSPVHTIGSQVIEAVRLHTDLGKAEARARAIELLRQVEIPNPEQMIDRYTFEFSGGMRQRAMIAMALAANPEVLIADEPTTALDVTTQAEILDLIKRLQVSRGMAMLLITHDMGVVAEVADEVAVMHFGRIVESGPVDEIFHDPKHDYTRRLLNSTVKLEQNRRAATRTENMTDRPVVLSARNITKTYGAATSWFGGNKHALTAVDNVSFDLHSGENLGIVGESGSGKTTLGRTLLRIVEPTSGQILFHPDSPEQLDITALSKRQLRGFHRQVRLIFQDPFASLNPRMTVRDIVGDPLVVGGQRNSKAIEDRVCELLELVGLDPTMRERYPHAFSGGQRQRIGIARALALDPKIIIADEATAALDVSIRAQILDLLLDVQKRLDLSFIFISHDISVVRYFCDRVAVMHRGKLVELGPAEQICTAPQEAYTKSLISAVPNPDPRNKRMLHRTRFTA